MVLLRNRMCLHSQGQHHPAFMITDPVHQYYCNVCLLDCKPGDLKIYLLESKSHQICVVNFGVICLCVTLDILIGPSLICCQIGSTVFFIYYSTYNFFIVWLPVFFPVCPAKDKHIHWLLKNLFFIDQARCPCIWKLPQVLSYYLVLKLFCFLRQGLLVKLAT